MAIVIGTEGRASHVRGMRDGHSDIFEGLDFWAPNINIFRDPRWGRGQETYGEDPFLTARLGLAFVTGMQGDDPNYYRVISTPKHYAVHSGPEPTRHTADVKVSNGKQAEPILTKYLKLRYTLMPYIYSLAYNTYRTGAPYTRALFMDFPNDPEVAEPAG
jgi:beta-glucosidase